MSFADRLADAVGRKGPLCVGLDPRWEMLPSELWNRHNDNGLRGMAEAFQEFSFRVLERVAPFAGVIKPQSAFFELAGPDGMRVLANVLARAREMGFLTILDAKRGDIASTATAYAEAAFGGARTKHETIPVWNADALTVNPYLGQDAVEPFLRAAKDAGRGVFVLARTSNPGAGLFQDLICDGRPLYRHVAEAVVAWNAATVGPTGFGDVGAVIGATRPAELRGLRLALPNVWFLVPGYGSQGGNAADVAAAYRADGLGAVINSSRGVTFPFQPGDPQWESKIALAAERAALELKPKT